METKDMLLAPFLTVGEVCEWEPVGNSWVGFLHRDTLNAWTRLRRELGVPIAVNSAWRSAWMNKKVGGQPTSQHLLGRALDLQCHNGIDLSAVSMVPFYLRCGFRGIGRGNGWVHLDTRLGDFSFWCYTDGGIEKDYEAEDLYKELVTEFDWVPSLEEE